MPEESTTPDLIELTRQWIETDSYDEWAAFAEQWCAPDVVLDAAQAGLGPYEGLAAVLAFLKEYWLTWEDHHHYAETVLDLGHGVVYSVIREHGRMTGSDAYVESTNAWVFLWVEGRAMRCTSYKDFDQARAAAERLADERE
jgi:ketosteroid isomerase-like protein